VSSSTIDVEKHGSGSGKLSSMGVNSRTKMLEMLELWMEVTDLQRALSGPSTMFLGWQNEHNKEKQHNEHPNLQLLHAIIRLWRGFSHR
jgi:hypothetical protein